MVKPMQSNMVGWAYERVGLRQLPREECLTTRSDDKAVKAEKDIVTLNEKLDEVLSAEKGQDVDRAANRCCQRRVLSVDEARDEVLTSFYPIWMERETRKSVSVS